jgi:hypothetical protein
VNDTTVWKQAEGRQQIQGLSGRLVVVCTDGQLDGGVAAVEGVHLHGAAQVGEESEVTQVGPQAKLAGICQSGAAHDQTSTLACIR